MIALYIVGGILLLLVLILLIPVGGEAEYDEDGFRLWLRLGPLRLVLLPKEHKPEDEEKKKKKAAEKAEKKAAKKKEKEKLKEEKPKEKKGGGLKEILELIPVGTRALGRLIRALRFKRIELAFRFGGAEDPSKAAMGFGGAWAGAGVLVPLLKKKLKVKHVDVRSSVDFTAEKTLVYAHGDLRVRPLLVVAIALRAGLRALIIHKKYMPPKEKRHRGKPEEPPAEETKQKKLTAKEIAERKEKYGKASDR
jgi:hypothetical protein